MYAVIVSGGKQYRVTKGDTIYVEKLDQENDSTVSFDVLMLGSDEGVKIGTPTVAGAKVEGKIVAQVKGEKVIIYKYKSKKNYHRRAGHRQQYTKVEITAVG
ncbi:MAG TPA: 50S ribosomal protein L21 [Candidatus Limiplasma sp.]|mgnify:FL=1|nr:50S ribosomal protein L21 [Candidatus Limiplasma sp.]HPS80305.1 50S ribosomal protein L21 [Candidatus Limiplasma sp.]